MNTPDRSTPPFRFVHHGACAVFGLVAAGSALLAAALIFGPIADRKVLIMAGGAPRAVASAAPSSAPLRLASSSRQGDR